MIGEQNAAMLTGGNCSLLVACHRGVVAVLVGFLLLDGILRPFGQAGKNILRTML